MKISPTSIQAFARNILFTSALACIALLANGCKKEERNKEELKEQNAFIEELVKEHNAARTNPKEFAEKYIKPKIPQNSSGVSSAQECYDIMRKMEPLKPLTLDDKFCLAAQYFADDHAITQKIGHTGSDGSSFTQRLKKFGATTGVNESCAYGASTPRETVVRLLIDDGTPSRLHRIAILNPDARVIGVGVAKGNKIPYGTVVVIEYGI